MLVTDFIKNPTLSFEVFPSSSKETYRSVARTVSQVAALQPPYMSVTFGKSSAQTDELSKFLSHLTTVVPHLTCKHPIRELDEILSKRQEEGLENILALRGDDISHDKPGAYFNHASDLILYIKQNYKFCVGAACYPEGHPEDKTPMEYIDACKLKQDSGADYLVTQMFFENYNFYNFYETARSNGVSIPIIPAVMPITSFKTFLRCKDSFGAKMLFSFRDFILRYKDDDEAIYQIGLNHAISQIYGLLHSGHKNIHVYIMNNIRLAEDISKAITPLL